MNSLRPDRDILRGSPLRLWDLHTGSSQCPRGRRPVYCKAVLPRPVLRHTRYSRLNPIKTNAE
eukprot:3845309-Prymnesium_polylepis.1